MELWKSEVASQGPPDMDPSDSQNLEFGVL